MSPIAKTNSPVNRIFGASKTASRTRQRAVGEAMAVIFLADRSLSYRRRPISAPAMDPGLRRDDCDVGTTSNLGRDDFFPHLGELRFVGRPDLVLREPAESLDIGGVDDHALGFEQLLGLGEIVDALGQLTDRLLRGARCFDHQLALWFGQSV